MRHLTSCGVVVFQTEPPLAFLLLRRRDRFDLPKGRAEKGEGAKETALRELHEETGLTAADIALDEGFRWDTTYPSVKRTTGEPVTKTLVFFLGQMLGAHEIVVAEHDAYEWMPWAPPHAIDRFPIDAVLAAIDAHWRRPGARRFDGALPLISKP